jgi:subtilisin family serine protease
LQTPKPPVQLLRRLNVARVGYVALFFLLGSPLARSALPDWRAYPNGQARIAVEPSSEWLLLETKELDALAVERVIHQHLPTALLARVERLTRHRTAIQIEGTDRAGLETVAKILRLRGLAHRYWPAVTRSTGVGFFDDRVVFSADRLPDPDRLRKLGVTLSRTSVWLPGVHIAEADDGDGVAAAWRLTRLPEVRWAEPDLIRHVELYVTTDDPQVGVQWHLDSESGLGSINAFRAWNTTLGEPETIIGIFDNGFDMDHPDLVANIVGGFDAVDGDDDPEAGCSARPDGVAQAGECPQDRPFRQSHGTAVAGVSAARGDNQTLGAGVCPRCSLYVVRMLGDGQGMRSIASAEAFQRATDDGVDAINNSWGPSLTRFFPLARSEREVFDRITTQARDGRGVILVFAAGNDFFTPATANPYASHPGVITVSASTRRDEFACYSNYGTVIAISGPSKGCYDGEGGLWTTDYAGGGGYGPEDFTTGFGGTSGAAPVVTGVVGLMLSANPDLTNQQVRVLMQSSADKIEADTHDWERRIGVDLHDRFGYDEHGFSVGFGYGRVNAAKAVARAGGAERGEVASVCDESCQQCFRDRCAPACAEDGDCVGATRCVDLGEDRRGCAIPPLALDTPGEPCTADCEVCVTTVDSELAAAEVCTRHCEVDDDCPFGFDCRPLGDGAARACIPGNKECGSPYGDVRCQSNVAVEGNGNYFCSCECIPGTTGACPAGFRCANVRCSRARGGLLCEPAERLVDANYMPHCVADNTVEVPCATHDDCGGGVFCIEGTCQPDQAEGGCDTCAACNADDDCLPGEQCVDTARGDRCLRPCEHMGPEDQCPADTICANVPGPPDDFCVNPDIDRKGMCPRGYRCRDEGRCFGDDECPEGETCEARWCTGSAEPDATPPVDAALMDAGMSLEDAEPPSADAGGGAGNELPAVRDQGCDAGAGDTPTPLAGCLLVMLLALRNGRRR